MSLVAERIKAHNLYKMILAIKNGNTDLICHLLQSIDVNAVCNSIGEGLTPLMQAASSGNIAVAKTLIEHGANVNKSNRFGGTPLHRAASHGRSEFLRLLIDSGADINAANVNGTTALTFAAYKGYPACVALLLEHGAHTEISGGNGFTALSRAVGFSMEECAELLVKAGADLLKAKECPLRDRLMPLHESVNLKKMHNEQRGEFGTFGL